MRCRTCDYPLWRTAARTCTECGSPFQPSDYTFVPATVVFRCPHCRQGYYGSGPDGLVQPREFDCVQCGSHLAIDQLVLEPAEGVHELDTMPMKNPWLHRGDASIIKAWWRTVVAILGSPARFMRTVPLQAPLMESVSFAGITAMLTGVAAAVLLLVVTLIAAIFGTTTQWTSIATQLGAQAVNSIFVLVSALVAGFVAHVLLVLFRGNAGGLGRSIHAILYAFGAANAISLAIICPCAQVAAPVWWCVAMSLMLRVAHNTVTWKTVTASIVASLVWLATLAVAGTASAILTGAGGVTFGTTTAGAMPELETRAFSQAKADGTTPFDAVLAGDLPLSILLDCIAPNGEPLVIGGVSRIDLESTGEPAIRRASTAIASLLPPQNAPFRLGRAVFVYRNAPNHARAWQIIVLPTQPRDEFSTWMILRRSSTILVDTDELPEHVAAENRRRQDAKLPPLPDLDALPDLLARPFDPVEPLDTPANP